jgi:hypothetical protein
MANKPKKVGGRREPPGGRPPKGNVKFYCYIKPDAIEQFDKERGGLTRGEFFMLVWANWHVSKSDEGDRQSDR